MNINADSIAMDWRSHNRKMNWVGLDWFDYLKAAMENKQLQLDLDCVELSRTENSLLEPAKTIALLFSYLNPLSFLFFFDTNLTLLSLSYCFCFNIYFLIQLIFKELKLEELILKK